MSGSPAGTRKSRASILADVGIGLAVLVLAVVLVRREFFPAKVVASSTATPSPTYVKEADGAVEVGRMIGGNYAKVHLLVFDDLECPFCANFHKVLSVALRKHSQDFSARFVHFPLSGHRFARPAAVAAECAAQLGKFQETVSQIFSKQDSLGLVSWNEYATGAGITDTAAFEKCRAQTPDAFPKIASDVAFARSLGVNSTPTIFINGWRLTIPPDEEELDRIIEAIKINKAPFK